MIETVQTNDGIDEQEFGYYTRMEGYANLSSDMKELYEISLHANEEVKNDGNKTSNRKNF
jgi:hypothetical protein